MPSELQKVMYTIVHNSNIFHYILYTDKYNKTTKWLCEVLSGLKTEQIKGVRYVTIQITPEAILQLAY